MQICQPFEKVQVRTERARHITRFTEISIYCGKVSFNLLLCNRYNKRILKTCQHFLRLFLGQIKSRLDYLECLSHAFPFPGIAIFPPLVAPTCVHQDYFHISLKNHSASSLNLFLILDQGSPKLSRSSTPQGLMGVPIIVVVIIHNTIS